MTGLKAFIEQWKPVLDGVLALSAFVNLIGWCAGGYLLLQAWRRGRFSRMSVGPFTFELQREEAIVATAAAARDWQTRSPAPPVDVSRIRAKLASIFTPEAADQLTGKSILWVDDNPQNNELAVRALRKLALDVEQVVSTEEALGRMQHRRFDLVISDMGRGSNMRAGYDLLAALRNRGDTVPFLIFAGADRPEYRKEAAERGAQLSTNDMLELIDSVIKHLTRTARG